MFVARDNVAAADRLIDDIQSRLWGLVDFPEMGQDVSWLLPGLRRLTMNQYLAFYSISDSPKSVIVERVLHAMRDVDPLIGEEQDKP